MEMACQLNDDFPSPSEGQAGPASEVPCTEVAAAPMGQGPTFLAVATAPTQLASPEEMLALPPPPPPVRGMEPGDEGEDGDDDELVEHLERVHDQMDVVEDEVATQELPPAVTVRKRRKHPFRLSSSTLFCTVPQLEGNPGEPYMESVYEGLVEFFSSLRSPRDVIWAVVAIEDHQDGGKHCHCIFRLSGNWDCRNPNALDGVFGKHGKYESPDSLVKTLEYVMKDGNWLSFGDFDPELHVQQRKKHKSTQSGKILDVVQSVMSPSVNPQTVIDRLYMDLPESMVFQSRKISEFVVGFCETQARAAIHSSRRRLAGFAPAEPGIELSPAEALVLDWLRSNVQVPYQERPFKQQQLWIAGPPGVGKTTLINNLEPFLAIYLPPQQEKWFTGYSDNYDLVVLDEFHGSAHVTPQFLNMFVQGGHISVAQKSGLPMPKKKNLPVMVLSNFTISGAFPKAPPILLAALRARFLEVWTDDFLRIVPFSQ